jgi:putative cell wall binding repeat protein
MRRSSFRLTLGACVASAACALAGCGGQTVVFHNVPVTVANTTTIQVPAQIGIPDLATKNTTRVNGGDPITDAAAVALAVYPSVAPHTNPPVVTVAPTNDWEAAIAASVLMAGPVRAPILLSGPAALPGITARTLHALAPSGSGAAGGAQVIRVGSVPKLKGWRTVAIRGTDPFTLAAAINRFANAAAGSPSPDVVVASSDDPRFAMPAAGWAAESGNPILFVTGSTIPAPTKQALTSDQHPHIYVLGPASVVPDTVLKQLRKYGTVKRVGASDPAANSVAFAKYRDPPCVTGQPCAHVPGSFGWALESPGHGYVLINAARTLDAAAAAPLSSSGTFGAQLLITDPNTLPTSVLNYFLDYATPGYTAEGPTAAVYNHGWMIGDESAISVGVQAETDTLLEPAPVKSSTP